MKLWNSALLVCICTVAAMPPPDDVWALELSGVLMYAADENGMPLGPAWHTLSGVKGARPLAFTRMNPPWTRGGEFANDSRYRIAVDLVGGTHMGTLFWQYDEGGFPGAVVLNLYFNGDLRSPGISGLVPYRRGMTTVRLNPSTETLSLYLERVDNTADLAFDGGRLQARLGAAFYMPAAGPTIQWRPGDFLNLDRVGPREIAPDGQPDGVLVFELTVSPSPPQRRGAGPGAPRAAAGRFVPGYVDHGEVEIGDRGQEGPGGRERSSGGSPAPVETPAPTPVAGDIGVERGMPEVREETAATETPAAIVSRTLPRGTATPPAVTPSAVSTVAIPPTKTPAASDHGHLGPATPAPDPKATPSETQ